MIKTFFVCLCSYYTNRIASRWYYRSPSPSFHLTCVSTIYPQYSEDPSKMAQSRLCCPRSSRRLYALIASWSYRFIKFNIRHIAIFVTPSSLSFSYILLLAKTVFLLRVCTKFFPSSTLKIPENLHLLFFLCLISLKFFQSFSTWRRAQHCQRV